MLAMKSEVVCWPYVVSDDLVERVDQTIYEKRRLTISELPYEISQILALLC
jgi:hypothetical protein